jgi:hypothetical protein
VGKKIGAEEGAEAEAEEEAEEESWKISQLNCRQVMLNKVMTRISEVQALSKFLLILLRRALRW